MRATGIGVDFEKNALEQHAALSYLEPLRHAGEKPLDDRFDFTTNNAVVRTSKTRVAQESGAAGENVFVGSLDMSVGSDDSADLAIEHSGQSNLFGSGLGVEVDEDGFRERTKPRYLLKHGVERVFQRGHEGASLEINNRERRPAGDLQHRAALPWRFGGIIERANKPTFFPEQFHNFLLVPKVVTAGYNIDSALENFLGGFRSNTGTACGILAVSDHGIQLMDLSEPRHDFPNRAPAGLANDISDEEQFHWLKLSHAH